MAGIELTVRRWLRLVGCLAVLTAMAAPAALGPALGPVLRWFGAEQVHLCKCGMTPGKCGCPECERLEEERAREFAVEATPALKRHCDEDAPRTPFAALPAAVRPGVRAIPPVPRSRTATRFAPAVLPCNPDREPPTPPPRRAAA